MKFEKVHTLDAPRGTITDWGTLGSVLGVKPNVMSYVLKNKKAMQKRIMLGDRVVYKSGVYLRHIQNRLRLLLEVFWESLSDTDCAIAYRKNFVASTYVANLPHAEVLMSFDIRKYYDHVMLNHITKVLETFGLKTLGARLIGRYCTISKGSLQQGSPASPVLSNIVGYYYFDQPIQGWLKDNYKELNYKYVRYCDNIALFLYDRPDADFKEKFKTAVKDMLATNGFKTHKWEYIADNNPKKHQKFLGIIKNSEARTDKATFNKLRAILFNFCLRGIHTEAKRYFKENKFTYPRYSIGDNLLFNRIDKTLKGHINYIASVSPKQGLMLKKLYAALEFLNDKRNFGKFLEDWSSSTIKSLKAYRNTTESVDDYMQNLIKIFG